MLAHCSSPILSHGIEPRSTFRTNDAANTSIARVAGPSGGQVGRQLQRTTFLEPSGWHLWRGRRGVYSLAELLDGETWETSSDTPRGRRTEQANARAVGNRSCQSRREQLGTLESHVADIGPEVRDFKVDSVTRACKLALDGRTAASP